MVVDYVVEGIPRDKWPTVDEVLDMQDSYEGSLLACAWCTFDSWWNINYEEYAYKKGYGEKINPDWERKVR